MPRPPINPAVKILDILDHLGSMPAEADSPLPHYQFGVNAAMNMRQYFMRPLEKVEHYPAVRDRYLHVLNNMVLVHLIQAFERFLKDLAGVCVDHLCDRVFDNRFDELSVQGGFLAAHLSGSTPGKALCESDTWLNCREINERFKKFLRDPFLPNPLPFHVFLPGSEDFRVMSLIWQLRHTIVHNAGVVTRSDAAKLRLLAKKQLVSPQVLLSESDDIRFLRIYLDRRAEDINRRVGSQLATVLTAIHTDHPALFNPQEEANELTAKLTFTITVAGAIGVSPA